MTFKPDEVGSFPLAQFRQFGILCYRRVAYLTQDQRLAKAVKMLEQSLGPPFNESQRRDAYNAANSAYIEISGRHNDMTIEAAVACTLVCACEGFANPNLLGNFEFVLTKAEGLSRAEIRSIEETLVRQIETL